MVVLLYDAADGPVGLASDRGSQIAELGITSVTLLRSGGTVSAVLEGWAFDPTRADEAAAILADRPSRATLREILHMAVGGADLAAGSVSSGTMER